MSCTGRKKEKKKRKRIYPGLFGLLEKPALPLTSDLDMYTVHGQFILELCSVEKATRAVCSVLSVFLPC